MSERLEARQWDGSDPQYTLVKWVREHLGPGSTNCTWSGMAWGFKIKTPHGYQRVRAGDYIVRDSKGEFHVCTSNAE